MNGPNATVNIILENILSVCEYLTRGVDLFFVLSGFLITGILLSTVEMPSYFKNFYARRALRIFPLYYIFLIFFFLLCVPLISKFDPSLYHGIRLDWLARHQIAYWAYYANWIPVFYWPQPGWAFIGHFWSLCVEEQFYIVWPAIIYIFGRRKAWIASIVAIFIPIIARYIFVYLKWNGIYSTTITHMDGLAIGSLAAYAYNSSFREKLLKNNNFLLLFGVILSLVASRYSNLNSTATISIVCCGLVLGSLRTGSSLERFFSSGVLADFGKYSYSMYIFHFPITWLLNRAWRYFLGDSFNWQILYMPLIIGMSYCIARFTWWAVEGRLLKLKRNFETH